MAVQRAVCIVRNESLLKQVFIVEPTTPLEEFRRMIADKFQHEVEELDLLLQNSTCPLLTIDATLATLSDTGIIFDLEARNNIMLLPKKAKFRQPQAKPPRIQPKEDGPSAMTPPQEARLLRSRNAPLPRSSFTGLVNNSNKCYLNSILQYLYMTPEFRNWVFRLDLGDLQCDFLQALQKLFIIMEATKSRAVSTRSFTAAFLWCKEHARDQQDVQELLTALCDEVEKSCAEKTGFTNIIKTIYEGQMKSFVVCGRCKRENSSTMTMRDMQLPLINLTTSEPFNTLEEALEGYVCPEPMVGSNAYACEHCEANTDSLKGLKLTQLPYIMTIQFMRFSYDPVTGKGVKVNSKMVYPDILNMDKFVTGGDGGTYELFCVFVHGGSTQAGHYYAHIKDFVTNRWYCFNDETVTEICDALRERAFGGTSSSNAYMIAYRRVSPEAEVAMHPVDLSTRAKILMKEYLYEKMESVYILYIHMRVKENTLVHTFYINGEATVQELLSDALRVFREYISGDTHHFRLITYNAQKKVLKETLENSKTITELNLIYDIQNLMLKICNPLNNIQKLGQVESQFPLWHCGKKLPGQVIIMDNHQYLANCDSFQNVATLSLVDEYFKAYVSSMSKYISQVFVNQCPLQKEETIKNHNGQQNSNIVRRDDILSIDPKFFNEDVYNKLIKLFVWLSAREHRGNLSITFNRRTGVLNINIK